MNRCRKLTEVAETDDLACKDHANETVYDFLEGVAMRRRHKAYPEPEVAMIFKKEPTDNSIDLTEVEASLQKAIKQVKYSNILLATLHYVVIDPKLHRGIQSDWKLLEDQRKYILGN